MEGILNLYVELTLDVLAIHINTKVIPNSALFMVWLVPITENQMTLQRLLGSRAPWAA